MKELKPPPFIPGVHKCCTVSANMLLVSIEPPNTVLVCKHCGRRHRRMYAEPGVIFSKGKELGK
jgi:hypothetical protein